MNAFETLVARAAAELRDTQAEWLGRDHSSGTPNVDYEKVARLVIGSVAGQLLGAT